MTNLTLLELGSNRIRDIQHVDALSNLQSLWLGKNKITQITNLDKLVNLRILSIQSNRLGQISGLDSLYLLEELYLSDNAINIIENISNLKKLRILDVASNKIKKMDGVSALQLVEFWGNDNLIEGWEEVDALSQMTCLQTIFLHGNPIGKHPQYKNKLVMLLPGLKEIDGVEVIQSSLTQVIANK